MAALVLALGVPAREIDMMNPQIEWIFLFSGFPPYSRLIGVPLSRPSLPLTNYRVRRRPGLLWLFRGPKVLPGNLAIFRWRSFERHLKSTSRAMLPCLQKPF